MKEEGREGKERKGTDLKKLEMKLEGEKEGCCQPQSAGTVSSAAAEYPSLFILSILNINQSTSTKETMKKTCTLNGKKIRECCTTKRERKRAHRLSSLCGRGSLEYAAETLSAYSHVRKRTLQQERRRKASVLSSRS